MQLTASSAPCAAPRAGNVRNGMRAVPIGARRGAALRTRVATPSAAETQSRDAFAELQALSRAGVAAQAAKQSVNRPQKVSETDACAAVWPNAWRQ